MEAPVHELELTRKLAMDAARAEKLAWNELKNDPNSEDLLRGFKDAHAVYCIMSASLIDVKKRMRALG